MGDMFAPVGEYLKQNTTQLHQGMGIENIVWIYAYAFMIVTFLGAVLLIMIARRITDQPDSEDELDSPDLPGGSGATAPPGPVELSGPAEANDGGSPEVTESESAVTAQPSAPPSPVEIKGPGGDAGSSQQPGGSVGPDPYDPWGKGGF